MNSWHKNVFSRSLVEIRSPFSLLTMLFRSSKFLFKMALGRMYQCKLLSYAIDYVSLLLGIAIAEISTVIEEKIAISDTTTPIFMMKDLRMLYQEKLRQLGAPEQLIEKVNVTKLKNRILELLPGLCEQKNGKYVILTLNGDVGKAIFEATTNSALDDGVILAKAAKIVRKHLFLNEEVFDGDISKARQMSSVPAHLLHLLGLILEGSTDQTSMNDTSQSIALNIAQLIRFNSVQQKRCQNSLKIRHARTNEPPLPVLVGLLIHSKTRKKSLVERIASMGLSITYSRVTEIQDTITKQACQMFEEKQMVCPMTLKEGYFIQAAIDNLDHNPTSSTSKESFHGTGISLFQYMKENELSAPFHYDPSKVSTFQSPSLPMSYTNILPTKGGKTEPDQYPDRQLPDVGLISENANDWLESLENAIKTDEPNKRVSFSAFFSTVAGQPTLKTMSTLLPLLEESINSPAMVRHCINIIKELAEHLNPQQMIMITADQPVYAIGKQVQWAHNVTYENVLWIMGPLHIEMALASAIGDWLEGSGWIDILKKANTSTSGRIESFLTGKKIKRTRYAHQVSLTCLLKLSKDAFKNQEERSDKSFEE